MELAELEQNTKLSDKIYKARKGWLVKHMTCTDTIKQLKHTVDCPKTKQRKTVDNTNHTSMVCVYTENFI